MLKERILELLEERNYPANVVRLVSSVIDAEQASISYELRTNSVRLRDIKESIRKEVEHAVKKS